MSNIFFKSRIPLWFRHDLTTLSDLLSEPRRTIISGVSYKIIKMDAKKRITAGSLKFALNS